MQAARIAAPVLVIDDDEFFLLAVERVLRDRLGASEIDVCTSVDEAMDRLLSDTHFGTCLVDLNMPGSENRELLESLRQVRPDMQVIVVSSSRARNDVLMALAAGACGFVHKGLGIGELDRALRQIAGGAVYVPPFLPDAPSDTGGKRSGRAATASLDALTPRQIEVLRLLTGGHPNKAIARSLDLSPATVKFHLAAIFRTLGVQNRVEAATVGARLLDEDAGHR